jgi:hypothetical protein
MLVVGHDDLDVTSVHRRAHVDPAAAVGVLRCARVRAPIWIVPVPRSFDPVYRPQ